MFGGNWPRRHKAETLSVMWGSRWLSAVPGGDDAQLLVLPLVASSPALPLPPPGQQGLCSLSLRVARRLSNSKESMRFGVRQP